MRAKISDQIQSWYIPAQAEIRFPLFNSVGRAFILQ